MTNNAKNIVKNLLKFCKENNVIIVGSTSGNFRILNSDVDIDCSVYKEADISSPIVTVREDKITHFQ